MGVQKTPIQKTYEISVGSDTINVDFLGSNRQFDWLEIPLVFDKHTTNTHTRQTHYKHTTTYDS